MITLDITGYGETPEYADMKAYDLLVQAESGLASITGHPAGPGRVGVSIVDVGCGMSAHAAILEALIERGITGRGKELSTSLFEATADWMTVPLLYTEGTGAPPRRLGLAHPTVCPYGAFALKDGALVLVSIQNEREWAQFCAVFLGDADLPQQVGVRVQCGAGRQSGAGGSAACGAVRSSSGARRPGGCCWRQILRSASSTTLRRWRDHPALRRVSVETPNGPARLASPPVRLDDGDRVLGPVPAIGEHSAAIRAEFG